MSQKTEEQKRAEVEKILEEMPLRSTFAQIYADKDGRVLDVHFEEPEHPIAKLAAPEIEASGNDVGQPNILERGMHRILVVGLYDEVDELFDFDIIEIEPGATKFGGKARP